MSRHSETLMYTIVNYFTAVDRNLSEQFSCSLKPFHICKLFFPKKDVTKAKLYAKVKEKILCLARG